ncbi:MAG TPA: fused MFS/spermidine synthase [Burkholderiaceae bacterium]|nr:fused MFS/spermidine synthase [Burkholderiaceae bacterium]
MNRSARPGPAPTYGLVAPTIFLGAFLLFLVQPIVAKLMLPRFGGSASVWATCLVFFQAALLCGYAYADQLVRRGRALETLHALVLLASLLLLPLSLGSDAASTQAPMLQALALLAASVGLPFVLLATTSPLVQAWTAGTRRNPYRLFAVSNLASLAALATYPWLIEPWLAVQRQALLWSLGYAAYGVLLCALIWERRRARPLPSVNAAHAARPGLRRFAAWIALAAVASFELVAVTNHLTHNMPSFPMMWVLPLVVYLVTFVLCFDDDRWYRPRLFAVFALLAVGAMAWMLIDKRFEFDIAMQSLVFVPALFVACMVCHGELAASRPDGPEASSLSVFYLCVAVGGAIGGALVGLAAPLWLPGTFEVEIGLVLVAGVLCARVRGLAWAACAAACLAGAIGTAGWRIHQATRDVVAMERNFYGVLRIREHGRAAEPAGWYRTLAHGGILHGKQYLAPDRRRQPTSYYTRSSGVGLAIAAFADRPTRVGVLGLGVGTLAAHGRQGDAYTFFEIDPAITAAARRHFSYLGDTPAAVEVVLGDGRLSLQGRADDRFDVLAIDAFSGDSIPVHLLTREAIALYAARTSADGVIALHLSNRYLDLKPVVASVAADLGLHATFVADADDASRPEMTSSDWVLVAKTRRALDGLALRDRAAPLPAPSPKHLWTDGFSNIVAVLRRDRMFTF